MGRGFELEPINQMATKVSYTGDGYIALCEKVGLCPKSMTLKSRLKYSQLVRVVHVLPFLCKTCCGIASAWPKNPYHKLFKKTPEILAKHTERKQTHNVSLCLCKDTFTHTHAHTYAHYRRLYTVIRSSSHTQRHHVLYTQTRTKTHIHTHTHTYSNTTGDVYSLSSHTL